MKAWPYALTAALLFLEMMALQSCEESRVERLAAKHKQIAERGCFLHGFYGRSGEYKVYNCHGWIVREDEL